MVDVATTLLPAATIVELTSAAVCTAVCEVAAFFVSEATLVGVAVAEFASEATEGEEGEESCLWHAIQ